MNIDDVFKSFEKKSKEQLSYIGSLSDEEKEQVFINEKEISEKIKLMLDKIDFEISDISTSFRKNHNTKDGELIDVYYTVFTSSKTQRVISVTTSVESKQMLYVKVGINKYILVEVFFELKE